MGGEFDRNKALGVALLASLVVVNAAVSYRNARAIRGDADWVEHAHEVLAVLGGVRADVRDLQASQLDYLLSGDDQALTPFRRADARLREGIARLGELTSDDPGRAPRVAALGELVRRESAQFGEAIRVRREEGLEAARDRVGASRSLVDEAGRAIDAIEAEEGALLRDRRVRTERSYRRAVLFGAAGTAFGLAAVGGVAWLLARGAAARRRGDEARARLAAIVESSDDAIVGKTAAGIVQTWNAGAEALFGYPAAEAVGRPIDLIVPPDRRGESRAVLARIARGERVEPFETVRLTRDGRQVDVSVSVSPIRDAAGRVVGASKVVRDVGPRKRAERLARQGEERFRTAADQAPVLIWIADATRACVWFNRPWLEFTGRTMEQERGDGWTAGVHPDDLGRRLDAYAASFDARVPFAVEYRLRRRDGEYRWLLDNGAPLYDPEGGFTGYIGSCVDVTDQKAAEAGAREAAAANAKFRTLFEQGLQFAGVLSLDGVVVEANRSCLDSCGFARPDVIGRPFWECGWWSPSPELAEMIRDACRRAAAGETIRGESQYFLADGSQRVVDLVLAPVVDDAGRVLFLSSTGTDVTDRKRAEQAVRESEARLREFADAAPAMLWATDSDGSCTFLSRGWSEFTGQVESEGLGRGWLDAIHPDDRARVEGAMRAANARREPFSLEHRLRRGDGSYRCVLDAGRPRLAEAGELLGYVGSVIDVDDRKAGEESLRRSEDRYRTLFSSIDQGFCVVEVLFDGDRPVDYRFLEANPVFETQTGLRAVVGRRVTELVPDLEDRWFAIYGRVATTGEPVRVVEGSEAMGRWFDVFAFRVDEPEARTVAILFTDVTARRLDELERDRLHRHVAEERERLAEAFERSPAFVALLRGPGHVYERTNERFLQLVGRRDLIGKSVREAVPEVGEQGYFETLDRVYRTGEAYVATDRRLTLGRGPGGAMEERWLDFVFQPLLDPDGGVTGILIHGIDLTDRKRAEVQLREKDQRLQLLLENAADYAVVVTDPGGIVVDWAGGASAVTGFAPADVLGGPADVLFTPEDREAGRPAYEMETAAREGRAEDKRWHMRKDGSQFFGEGVMVPLRGDGGLHGFGKVFRDMTARKRAEESVRFLADASASLAELVDYESTLQRIANIAVGGFADWCAVDVLDDDGGRRRLAVTRSEPTTTTSARVADAAGREAEEITGVIPHVLRTGEPEVVFDLADLKPDAAPQGWDRILRLRAAGVRSYLCVPVVSRGRVVGGITFLSASDRRRFGREELRVAQDLAERVAVAIENARLYRDLQEADRRKDEFLATLAHELRNPLSPVRNGVQILRLGGPDGAARERTLAMMDRQIAHLVRLVDDLMDVSRVTSGKVVLRREPVDLRSVVESAVETSRQMIDAGGHGLEVRLAATPLTLDADRTRLVQVVANLLNNAAKYTPHGGRIELSAGRDGDWAVVRVADTGIGVPADMLPRIFDMFTQVGTSLDRAQGGLGIGLTLVRRLVEMHGGTVAAESAGPDRGAVFTVRLPLARDPQGPVDGPEAASDEPAAPRRNILVVDDNRDSAESLAQLLGLQGHDVRTAHDGPEALRTLETFRPHLILLDLGLPGMSGFEVARRIRASVGLKGVRLAALTGWGQDEDRRRTREAGFDHHLVKPADPAAVEAILADLEAPPRVS
ncbi:PAS domain S-box protein [Paludisphaera mucosa]|uniref:histidine kinase n=1 Tax=Paludisphaera mucosa TaxID=3030827 RepID=A0ABT6FKB6_9BACT|nr:PAS domain S-box protein [Paludisphaera mucosa]MDG3008026.1 PAS domain S-box protein [Paludisphaera mucosa]